MTKKLGLEEIKNISDKVYVRWSKSIELDTQRGYSLAYGSSAEAGLSCCEIDTTWQDWRIVRQLLEYRFCGGNCWIITGDVVGRGEDNEPLLRNIELLGKVSANVIEMDWRAMARITKISEYREKLTRITDPFAKQIVEKALEDFLKDTDPTIYWRI